MGKGHGPISHISRHIQALRRRARLIEAGKSTEQGLKLCMAIHDKRLEELLPTMTDKERFTRFSAERRRIKEEIAELLTTHKLKNEKAPAFR